LIKAITRDRADLMEEIKDYRIEVKELRSEVNELNIELRRSHLDCTNMIMAREREIMEYIIELETLIKKSIRSSTPIAIAPQYRNFDTTDIYKQPDTIILDDNQTEMILEGLENIRKKINDRE
jgi:hypothetical protein